MEIRAIKSLWLKLLATGGLAAIFQGLRPANAIGIFATSFLAFEILKRIKFSCKPNFFRGHAAEKS
jgi:hypothetical protein